MSSLNTQSGLFGETRGVLSREITSAFADAHTVLDANDTPPHFTTDEAAVHLNRSGATWNKMASGDKPQVLGKAVELTFGFRETNAASPYQETQFSKFSADQIKLATLALQTWSDVAGLTFDRVGQGTGAAKAYSDEATILFGNFKEANSAGAAHAYLPQGPGSKGFDNVSGDVWVNVALPYEKNPEIWDYGFLTLIHEIGHALGLSHPGDYNAGDGGPITYPDSVDYLEDTKQYTVMSYFGETYTGADYHGQYSASPMLHDIAAMQRLYGANMDAFTGDTTYGFDSNSKRVWFTAATAEQPLIFAVWDAGGNDTFNFSGYSEDADISLVNNTFSSVGGDKWNIAISQAVKVDGEIVNLIENAMGGSGDDKIKGNIGKNELIGNDGDDKLNGGIGGDTLIGGAGADTLTGSRNADVFQFNAVSDSTADSHDFINDLQKADTLDLHLIDANSSKAGNQAFHLVDGGEFDHSKGALIIFYNETTHSTFIEGDVNGDGVADLVIEAKGDKSGFEHFVL